MLNLFVGLSCGYDRAEFFRWVNMMQLKATPPGVCIFYKIKESVAAFEISIDRPRYSLYASMTSWANRLANSFSNFIECKRPSAHIGCAWKLNAYVAQTFTQLDITFWAMALNVMSNCHGKHVCALEIFVSGCTRASIKRKCISKTVFQRATQIGSRKHDPKRACHNHAKLPATSLRIWHSHIKAVNILPWLRRAKNDLNNQIILNKLKKSMPK